MKLMRLIKIILVGLLILMASYQIVINTRTQENTGHAPIINSDVTEIRIPCQYKKEDLLQGLTAYDEEDGYLTEKILIGAFSDFTERGVSSLDYAVYDKDGHIGTFNRRVVFTDYTPPKIRLKEPWVFNTSDAAYGIPSLNLEARDKLDGDISKHILINTNGINFTVPGKYTASVNVKNSFGDEVNMELPVHILDSSQSGFSIELNEPLIYVDQGAAVNPATYIAAVKNGYTNEIIPVDNYKLTINSDVDTSKDGIYEIQFSAVSPDESTRGDAWMIVVVGDYGG